jgi:hypothetical protein
MIEYNHLLKGELPVRNEYHHYKEGVYWIDEFRDVLHSLVYFRKERYGLRGYLRPYVSDHVFAVFEWGDPVPFMKRVWDIAKKTVSPLKHLWGSFSGPRQKEGTRHAK